MKKIYFASLIFLIILLFSTSAYAISEGDYISAGKFESEPVLWRCVSVSNVGAYLISDQVIMKRPFDAEGLNSWKNSDIRAYLNSDFLDIFSASERKVILESDIKSISDTSYAENEHVYNSDFKSAVQNADVAYGEVTCDKIFLPSIAEIQLLHDNVKVFGPDYYMGHDGSGNYKEYFLRDALSFSKEGTLVRCVMSDLDIRYSNHAYNDFLIRYAEASNKFVGIRPAFYLSTDSTLISGDGSRNNPYIIADEEFCTIEYNCEAVLLGTEIMPTVRFDGYGDECIVKYFCNGVEYRTDVPCTVMDEVNQIYAVVYDKNGKVLDISDTIYVEGISLESKKYYLNENFESTDAFDKQFAGYGVSEGDNIQKTVIDDKHNNVLSVSSHIGSTFINSNSLNNATGKLVFQSDFMLCDLNFTSRPLFYICTYKNGEKVWITPILIYPDGTMKFSGTDNGGIVKKNIKVNQWYSVTLIYDLLNKKVSFALDGEVLVLNASVSAVYDYFSYLNISYTTPGAASTMYFDNMKIFTNNDASSSSQLDVPHFVPKSIKKFDFSSEDKSFNLVSQDTENSFAEIVNINEGEHNNVAHLKTMDNAEESLLSAKDSNIFANSPQSLNGAMILSFDFKILDMDVKHTMLGALCYRNSADIEQTWNPLCFESDGSLYVSQSIDYDASSALHRRRVQEFKIGKWHNVQYMIDTANLLIYVFFDGKIYAQVDYSDSIYENVYSKVLDVAKSRLECNLKFETVNPGEGKCIEFYVDNIELMYSQNPIIYNLKYENVGTQIFRKPQIKDLSELKISADVVGASENILVATAIVNSENKLASLVITKPEQTNLQKSSIKVLIEDLPEDIINSRIYTLVWNIGILKPYSHRISFE